MSDLNTMYKNGMGSLASLHMGQSQAADREKQALAMQFEQQKMQQQAQMHPLEMQQKQATLASMAAQLPGQHGMSQSLAAKGEMDVATKSGMIAQKFVEMAGKIGDEGMKNLGRDGERALQAVAVIEKLPPAMHKQAYAQFVQQYGGDPNSPMVKGIMGAPDGEFLSTLKAMGNGMATASQKFVQESAHKKAENESQERTNAADNTRAVEVARIQAESRIKAAESRSELAMSKMSTDQKIAYLTSIPPDERTPAESNQLNELSQQRLAERTAGNNSVAPTVLGQPTNQQNARTTANELFPRQAAPAPNAVVNDDPAAFAKANGLPYDTSKYVYKMVNGQLLKKPK